MYKLSLVCYIHSYCTDSYLVSIPYYLHLPMAHPSLSPSKEAVQHKDALLEENRQLAAANEQYLEKTVELRGLMDDLVVSAKRTVKLAVVTKRSHL